MEETKIRWDDDVYEEDEEEIKSKIQKIKPQLNELKNMLKVLDGKFKTETTISILIKGKTHDFYLTSWIDHNKVFMTFQALDEMSYAADIWISGVKCMTLRDRDKTYNALSKLMTEHHQEKGRYPSIKEVSDSLPSDEK